MKRCKAITQRISEEITEVEGEWLTVADMKKLEFSEPLSQSSGCCDVSIQVSALINTCDVQTTLFLFVLDELLRTKIKGVMRFCESRPKLQRPGFSSYLQPVSKLCKRMTHDS